MTWPTKKGERVQQAGHPHRGQYPCTRENRGFNDNSANNSDEKKKKRKKTNRGGKKVSRKRETEDREGCCGEENDEVCEAEGPTLESRAKPNSRGIREITSSSSSGSWF